MKEPEMEEVGGLMAEVLGDLDNAEVIESVKGKVADLVKRFPLYE
jgi:glycine hydroxymethyltransferase